MTPSRQDLVTFVDLAGDDDLPLVVVGPSLGTRVQTLWSPVADRLARRFRVVGWDLPGHGPHSRPVTDSFTIGDLAAGVLAAVDRLVGPDGNFYYAGDSIGGAVGQQLLCDAPMRLRGVALVCTAAQFGEPGNWFDRAELVRRSGTAAVVEGSRQRWFAPGFVEAHPEIAEALLRQLPHVDRAGYAECCAALAGFDLTDRSYAAAPPVLVVSGRDDVAAPPDQGSVLAAAAGGPHVVLHGVGHLAPVEAPGDVARLLLEHFGAQHTGRELHTAGMAVRRQVLGDDHVDRAGRRTSDLTREFQDLITRYAWGEIWTRPGLDRRSRSMVTLTAMIARGHHDELAMHLRAARRNSVTLDEIKEVILQCAIYCGVPDANTAFRIAQQVFESAEPGQES